MTKPTILAGNKFSSETLVPRNTDGGDKLFSSTYTVPASTVVSVIIGMLRINKNDRIQITSAWTDDLDTGSGSTFSIGYAYDDNTLSGADDDNAFVNLQSAQAAASIGAGDSAFQKGAFNFVSAGLGYLILTTKGGTTTTEGDIIINGVIGRS